MSRIVAVPLDGGVSVLVEAAEGEETGIDRVSRLGDAVRDSAETLQQALTRVRPAVAAVFGSMRTLPEPPEKISVEFGIRLTAEAGVVVARASTEANFTVTLEWTVPRDADPS